MATLVSASVFAVVMVCAVRVHSAEAVMVAAKHVDVELVADTASVAPGTPFRLGVRFVPEKEWR